jgi:chromosome segregation ATPase
MGAVATLRKIVTGSDPIAEAEEKLAAAQREHDEAAARVADITAEISKLEKAFRADADDRIADQIVRLDAELKKRRLYLSRATSLVGEAQSALVAAKNAKLQAELAALDAKADPAKARNDIRELWQTRGVEAIKALEAVILEAEAIAGAAGDATREACRLRGIQGEELSRVLFILAPAEGVLRVAFRESLQPMTKLRLRRLIDA